MRMQNKKYISYQWLVNNEPLVVLGSCKKRDGPILFHGRDGPLFVTGPPGGAGNPEETATLYTAGFPKVTGPPRTGVG